ncbi:MAG TPA: hypothetical protein VGO96_12455 [Pyrinomonadaceae bacterium]|jgi:RNA polymerase sigma factor (sigma-70 family)|nr:hypothetical protein [Pyrinomonadaceae bacterium]
MPKERIITKDKFDELLAWLDPDRERAAIKYEQIRQSLIKIAAWRGCSDAEGLADEAIDRVTQRVDELRATYVGDPALYFYSVSRRLIFEHWRLVKSQVPLEEVGEPFALPQEEPDDLELEEKCLNHCLQKLSPENRELIMAYYRKEKQAKIDCRKELAEQLGIATNALRVKIYRIRAKLEICIERCMKRAATDEID